MIAWGMREQAGDLFEGHWVHSLLVMVVVSQV